MEAAVAYSDASKDLVGGWEGVNHGISDDHCGGGSGDVRVSRVWRTVALFFRRFLQPYG